METVEKLMEETAEAREYQREVGEMLAGVMTGAEEEEVQEEMERLEAEEAGKRGVVGGVGEMPEVPGGELPERTVVGGRGEEVGKRREEREMVPA